VSKETRTGNLDLSGGFGSWACVISAGIFATTLPQSQNLALPLRDLLGNELHATLPEISLFFGIAAIPWYCKIVVGIFADNVPVFGTLRRNYILLGATAAGALWLLAGYTRGSYASLLATVTGLPESARPPLPVRLQTQSCFVRAPLAFETSGRLFVALRCGSIAFGLACIATFVVTPS
jgi:hypothetical protein